MLTDFTQFLVIWVGDEILVITAFTVAGAMLLALLVMLAARRGGRS